MKSGVCNNTPLEVTKQQCARSEVLTEVTLEIQVSWDDTVSTGKLFDVPKTSQTFKASYLPIDTVLSP